MLTHIFIALLVISLAFILIVAAKLIFDASRPQFTKVSSHHTFSGSDGKGNLISEKKVK